MRSGIICGGNWIVDRVKTIDAYPREETLANILCESRQNGGCAFNVLVDLAKLGADFPLYGIGVVGDDEDGAFARAVCLEYGIDVGGLVTAMGASTSYTDVMTDQDSGRRTFFHSRGANALLSEDHFDFSAYPASHLHLGYLLLLDRLDVVSADGLTGAAGILQAAQEAGLTTSIDLVSEDSDRFGWVVPPSLPFVDFCFMNEFELSRVSEVDIYVSANLESLNKAAERVFSLGLTGSLVVHSAEFVYTGLPGQDGALRRCPKATNIRGTVGAGDAFAAGFLLAVQEGASADEAVDWALLAAGSCLSGQGASDGVRAMSELRKTR